MAGLREQHELNKRGRAWDMLRHPLGALAVREQEERSQEEVARGIVKACFTENLSTFFKKMKSSGGSIKPEKLYCGSVEVDGKQQPAELYGHQLFDHISQVAGGGIIQRICVITQGDYAKKILVTKELVSNLYLPPFQSTETYFGSEDELDKFIFRDSRYKHDGAGYGQYVANTIFNNMYRIWRGSNPPKVELGPIEKTVV